MTRPCLGPDRGTRPPRSPPPPGSCDAHVHIFDDYDRYPLSPNRSFTPPEAPVGDLLRMLGALGIERAVVVHSSAYGTDTRVSEAAVRSAPDRLRGVAVTAQDTPFADLERLDAAGFSGSRLSTVVRGTLGFDALEPIAGRIRPFGWHVAVHVNRSEELVALAPRLLATGNTIVVDHVGRVRAEEGVGSAGYAALLELLRSDRCWVKLSALHRTSGQGLPWDDMRPLVEGVLRLRPDRVVWGTDWPHVNQYDAMQNDGDLLDALSGWVGDDALMHRILVENPATLYRFPLPGEDQS
ncbi:amidohydrolase family protein [Muricoccus vinaceus]|uniref:Amidohydrolase family protein n=1 Tax=Muricoccus vinaceus TaxID=424704 RepID=A0ABV6INL9_9PROT